MVQRNVINSSLYLLTIILLDFLFPYFFTFCSLRVILNLFGPIRLYLGSGWGLRIFWGSFTQTSKLFFLQRKMWSVGFLHFTLQNEQKCVKYCLQKQLSDSYGSFDTHIAMVYQISCRMAYVVNVIKWHFMTFYDIYDMT